MSVKARLSNPLLISPQQYQKELRAVDTIRFARVE